MRYWFTKMAVVLVLTAMAGAAFGGTTPLNAVSEDGVLVFQSDDNAFKWWFDARVYLDMATYFDDEGMYNVPTDPDDLDDFMADYGDLYEMHDGLAGGFLLRRARFALKSQLWNDWYSEIDMDFAEESAAVKDAYLSYRGLFNGNGRVRVGNFRQPNGLEEVTTSRNLMFMERSQGTEPFVVGRRIGVEVTGWKPQYRASVSMFGADVEDYLKEANEQMNFAGRVNYAPIQDDDSTLMIGGSATLRRPTFVSAANEDGERSVSNMKINSRPETNLSDTKFVYAKLKDVDKMKTFCGELAYVYQRFMVQGEYMMANFDRYEDKESISYGGGYAFASFFLTDDMHAYDHKDAEFARVVPRSEKGAWEVALRFSTIDLNDTDAGQEHGASTSYTLGVNYYPNPNVKMMLNYGIVDNDEFATGTDDQFVGDYDFSYVQMRFQTAF